MFAKKRDIEEDLVLRCKKRDSAAQAMVYEKFRSAMYCCALRLLNDPMEAEDAMHDGFIVAFEKIDSFKVGGSFGGWIKRIVVNKSIDRLRKRKYHFDDVESIDVEDEVSVEMDLSVADIQAAMSHLPERNRLVFTLHLFDDLKHEEIAEMLGMSHGAVRVAYIRAKGIVKEKLNTKLAEING